MTFKEYCNRLNVGIKSLDIATLNTLIEQIKSRINTNNQIFLIGNGGSAANCYHIVGDYIKTFSLINKRINIKCFSDNTCYLSATANDLDYSQVYEILIGTQIQKKDLIIFFSGSGNSINLIKACRKAIKHGIYTTAITGYKGGELGKIVNNHIYSKIDDMEVCEDIQMIIMHYIKQVLVYDFNLLCDSDFDKDYSKKYSKRTVMGEIA